MIRIKQNNKIVGPEFKTNGDALDWGLINLPPNGAWKLCDQVDNKQITIPR